MQRAIHGVKQMDFCDISKPQHKEQVCIFRKSSLNLFDHRHLSAGTILPDILNLIFLSHPSRFFSAPMLWHRTSKNTRLKQKSLRSILSTNNVLALRKPNIAINLFDLFKYRFLPFIKITGYEKNDFAIPRALHGATRSGTGCQHLLRHFQRR